MRILNVTNVALVFQNMILLFPPRNTTFYFILFNFYFLLFLFILFLSLFIFFTFFFFYFTFSFRYCLFVRFYWTFFTNIYRTPHFPYLFCLILDERIRYIFFHFFRCQFLMIYIYYYVCVAL